MFRFHTATRRPGIRTYYFKFRLTLKPIERILVSARTVIRAVLQRKYKDYPAWNASESGVLHLAYYEPLL